MILQGIPNLIAVNNGSPTGVVSFSSGQITLSYAAAVAFPNEFTIRTGDPALRTTWGGFLAAGAQVVNSTPWPPPVITDQPWTASISGVQVIVAVGGSGAEMLSDGIPQFANLNTMEFPTAWSVSGNQVTLTYTTPPTSGDEISVTNDLSSDLIFIDGSRCVDQTVTLA